jgi:hypothetical protein
LINGIVELLSTEATCFVVHAGSDLYESWIFGRHARTVCWVQLAEAAIFFKLVQFSDSAKLLVPSNYVAFVDLFLVSYDVHS